MVQNILRLKQPSLFSQLFALLSIMVFCQRWKKIDSEHKMENHGEIIVPDTVSLPKQWTTDRPGQEFSYTL